MPPSPIPNGISDIPSSELLWSAYTSAIPLDRDMQPQIEEYSRAAFLAGMQAAFSLFEEFLLTRNKKESG